MKAGTLFASPSLAICVWKGSFSGRMKESVQEELRWGPYVTKNAKMHPASLFQSTFLFYLCVRQQSPKHR